MQRSDSGIWLYPTGWCDVGYSASEVVLKEVWEETGIEAEVVAPIAIFDGLRLGFTGIPLYSIVFACRPIGGELKPHPLECRTSAGSPRTSSPSRWPVPTSGSSHAFKAIRGEQVPVWFDPPRRRPWREHEGVEPMTDPTAIEIAESVRSGERSAREVLETTSPASRRATRR